MLRCLTMFFISSSRQTDAGKVSGVNVTRMLRHLTRIVVVPSPGDKWHNAGLAKAGRLCGTSSGRRSCMKLAFSC